MMERKPETTIKVKSNIIFDFWACQRPLTSTWGSGQVFERIVDLISCVLLKITQNTAFESFEITHLIGDNTYDDFIKRDLVHLKLFNLAYVIKHCSRKHMPIYFLSVP